MMNFKYLYIFYYFGLFWPMDIGQLAGQSPKAKTIFLLKSVQGQKAKMRFKLK